MFIKTISKEKEVNAKKTETGEADREDVNIIIPDPRTDDDENGTESVDDLYNRELTREEKLALDLCSFLAEKTADRFECMIAAMDEEKVGLIIGRIYDSKPETMIKVLQALFISNDYYEAAEDLEILDICNRQVDCSTLCFVDEFLSSDVMDRLLTERSIEELFRKVWMPACLS